ncbi:amino acid adenylation domain-containing protein [Streptomyces sp. NPDC001750]|uniref:amino acid adenylation domain-containing protein n=1 Tax=unclassified Streptomyces TaxID=2593676 RepID=UPI0036CB2710
MTLLIHQLIAEQAARRPDKPAVVSAAASLTYGELDRRANRLAAHLRTLGAAPEVRVGVCLPRSADAVVALLGVVKSGAAPVLLDPAAPGNRIALMLRDSGARALVTTSDTVPGEILREAAADGIRPVLLDRDTAAVDAHPSTDPGTAGLTPDNAAHVVYTSGSSGEPKGVVARHATVLHCARWTHQEFAVTADDRSTWVSSPGFGVSLVNELWPFLSAGCTVHLPDEETLLFPERLRDWLTAHRITVVQLVATLAAGLCATAWPDGPAPRLLLVTGERFEPAADGPPFDVAVTYGSTETTHITSRGRAVPHARVHLLDENLAEVPPGTEGEIHVAGPGLARGYAGDPALTALRWLPDPFAAGPGARMYRTGDVGRLLDDGTLDIVGRTDRQVKIRGKRVHLDEVERSILRGGEAAEAAVVARGEGDRRRLVAYVTAVAPDRVPHLHSGLRRELPDHMLPSDFVLLDSLPRTLHGKLDRQALPEPGRDRSASAAPMKEARDDLERELTRMWCELLGLDRVGTADDFFDLGGHSLLAVQLVGAVEDRFGAYVDLPAFYERPTVADLAELISAAAPGPSGACLVRTGAGPGAVLRLVCFPFAGGGPSAYQSWADALPPEIELVRVQPPGRGERLAEKPLERVDELVTEVGKALAELDPLPTAFFGHSSGAVVAYELALWQRRHGHTPPVHLFASGSAAPHVPVTTRVHRMTDDELREHLRGLGGTPPELLDDPRLLQVMLPTLRADFALHETYTHRPEPPLDCPVTVFGGTEDTEVDQAELPLWRTLTRAAFETLLVTGGHFYLDTARDALLSRMLDALAPPLARPRSGR